MRETIALRDDFSLYDMAMIYAAWRETESALQWLRQAVEQCSVDVVLDPSRSATRQYSTVFPRNPQENDGSLKFSQRKRLPRASPQLFNARGGYFPCLLSFRTHPNRIRCKRSSRGFLAIVITHSSYMTKSFKHAAVTPMQKQSSMRTFNRRRRSSTRLVSRRRTSPLTLFVLIPKRV